MKESVEPVEPIVVEEKPQPVVEVVEEKPKKVDKLKKVVKCPDCAQFMTVHTLKYIHKRRGFCKADVKAVPEQPVPEKTPEPIVQQKPKITEDAVNALSNKILILFLITLGMKDLWKHRGNRCMFGVY